MVLAEKLYKADITIIGAGVIGLAIAAQVARKGRGVYVLEKNETFGKETSSRNSEVIHAGFSYPEGSLKAETCAEGNTMLYEICEKYGIGCQKIGKLMVAITAEEVDELESLLERGRNNGVKDLRMLSKGEIKRMEPNVEAIAAIFSPSTGIMDSHALMKCFLRRTEEKGGEVAYKSKVIGIEKLSHGYKLTVEDSSGIFSFKTEVLINCAGLNSDKIAQFAGIDTDRAGYRLFYCKGEYFTVGNSKNRLIRRLVYPVLGLNTTGMVLHVTLNLENRMLLGPSSQYVSEIDYKVDESQKEVFYQSTKRFLPFIEFNDLEPEMAGIRPRLQGPGDNFRDFVIRHEQDKGLPGFINLVGIESPGLTSAPAIAKYVEHIVNEIT